jgi:peptide/nickel transport system permease protein
MNEEMLVGKANRPHVLPRLSGSALLGMGLLGGVLLVSFVGTWLTTFNPNAISGEAYAAPDAIHLFGTDTLGRDVLARLIYGSRYTLGLSMASAALGFVLGAILGFVAGETGGHVDDVAVWVTDVLLSFPPLLFALIIIAALGSNLVVLVAAIAILHVPRTARVARALARRVAGLEFVELARARGEGLVSVLVREILPNTKRGLAAEFGLRLTFSILLLSSLSFLGLGIQPPAADWGMLVRENTSAIRSTNFWAELAPALAIAALAVGIAQISDWLGDQSAQGVPAEIAR